MYKVSRSIGYFLIIDNYDRGKRFELQGFW